MTESVKLSEDKSEAIIEVSNAGPEVVLELY